MVAWLRGWGERCLLASITLYFLGMLLPASIWFDEGTVVFEPNIYLEPIELVSTSETKRPFDGSYSVVGRTVAKYEIVCQASSSVFRYKVESTKPDPLYMSWWAENDERCHVGGMKPGKYLVETCWTIHRPLWILPNKTICTDPALLVIKRS